MNDVNVFDALDESATDSAHSLPTGHDSSRVSALRFSQQVQYTLPPPCSGCSVTSIFGDSGGPDRKRSFTFSIKHYWLYHQLNVIGYYLFQINTHNCIFCIKVSINSMAKSKQIS